MINKFLIYVLALSIPSLGLSITIDSEYLILPAGISGIGKTTITDAIIRYLLSHLNLSAQTLPLDSFYRDGAWGVAFYRNPTLFLNNSKELVIESIDLFLKEHGKLGFSNLRLHHLPHYKGQPTWESEDSINWNLLTNFFEVMSSKHEFHYAQYLYGMLEKLNEDNIPKPIVRKPVIIIDGLQVASREMFKTLKSLDLKTPTGERPSILILNIKGDLETAIQRSRKRDRATKRNAGTSDSPMEEQVAAMLSLKPEQMEALSHYLRHLPEHISDYLREDSDLNIQIIDFDNTDDHDFETSLPSDLESALNKWMTK